MPVPRRASPPEVRREECTPRATSPGRAGASSALSRPMPPLAVGAIVTGERPLVLAVGHATTDGTAHEPQPDQPRAAVLRLPGGVRVHRAGEPGTSAARRDGADRGGCLC